MTPRRVALFGGSFNPPHVGHVLIATWALCAGDPDHPRFDEVRLIPTLGHPFSKELATFEHRLAMTRAAVAHLGPRVSVDPIEATLPTPSYTFHTIQALLTAEPELEPTWLMGGDAWRERHAWHRWEDLVALLAGRLLVINRGEPLPPDTPQAGLTVPPFSSTAIRRAIAAKAPHAWMLPEAVATHIAHHGLYLPSSSPA